MNNEKTGNLISQIRKEKGLTQMQLAQKLGVSNATISKWETAKGFPDISLIEPLAETLDISVSEILTGERFEKNDEIEELLNDLVDISINEQKRKEKIHNWIIAITVAILYLIVSLITKRWEVTWIIWFVYCFYRVATEYILKKH
ncbi:Helix-turn-helix domain-containing protein [Eubacterium uniforme]|uniref:Helix-turn-helix domain-containing protein n=1 Tax=Eubacterium uniforme TaxID=39495 RepID=A0A1T4W1F0_9FIRM|nr:helix-turn-helix domain-containing protein [Eubacterium uniforme]SKA71017.1 Helix-turn-helix domain-containing protein [Eubacterium uniforme]